MYGPQQIEVITGILGAIEDGRITALERQNIVSAILSFGMSLISMTFLGMLVRAIAIEALEEPEEKRVMPVINAILPQAR